MSKHRCQLEGCEKPYYGSGYCSMHYTRMKRHGDPHTNLRPRDHANKRQRGIAAVKHAVRTGVLIKPDICSRCRTQALSLHGHHYKGYDNEHLLDVAWLCISCHNTEHPRWNEQRRREAAQAMRGRWTREERVINGRKGALKRWGKDAAD